jgi:hypothetical protein
MTCSNHPDRENVAFCQNCGKPLCQECTRVVGSAVFCEPCLAARLAGAAPPAGSYTAADPNAAYAAPGTIPPHLPKEPNPGLAALLGLIPGVGAMYNEQYAKGVVHLIVFAILISLADEHGIFGIFIAGWVCYQVIEAHHTAKARRDGTPLPNPFGLNDLGERLGFGKSWPGASSAMPPSASAATPPGANPYAPPAPGYVPPAPASWSAPWDTYSTPPVQPIPPYGVPIAPIEPLPARNRFPAGALWLIGLGCLFLIGNAGLFRTFPIHHIVPIILIALGVWLFVRKMTDSGPGFVDDGTPGYQFRLFRALRGSIWIVLIGVLFELDSLGVLSWAHSWPILVIVAGLMAVFQRVSFNAAMTAPYPYPPVPPITPTPPPDPANSTQHDQEGR